jgi:hypothetical protein
MLEWIMEYETSWVVVGGNMNPDDVKQKLLERLKQKLCLYGYDLCWVDIEFEIEIIKDADGKMIGWEITKFNVKPRKTKKRDEDCKCPLQELDDDNEQVADNQETETTEVGHSGDEDLDGVEDERDPHAGDSPCCECTTFDPMLYTGRVTQMAGQFVASGYEECGFMVAEPEIHQKILEKYPEEGELVFMEYIAPHNEGVEFDLETGVFYRDGEEFSFEL